MARKPNAASPFEERLAYIEKERKIRLAKLIVLIVLASLFGAGGFAGMVVCLIVEFTPSWARFTLLAVSIASFLLLTMITVLKAASIPSKHREDFFELFEAEASKGLYDELECAYRMAGKDIIDAKAEGRRTSGKAPDTEAGPYLRGKKGNVSFYSFPFLANGLSFKERGALSIEEETLDGRPIKSRRQPGKDLVGRYFLFKAQEEFPLSVHIRDRRWLRAVRRPFGHWVEFSGESTRFNECFRASYSGGSNEDAYSFLTPSFMSRLLLLEDEYGGYFSLLVEGRSVHCLLDHYDSGLNLSLARRIDRRTVDYLRAELSLPSRIIEALGLKDGR